MKNQEQPFISSATQHINRQNVAVQDHRRYRWIPLAVAIFLAQALFASVCSAQSDVIVKRDESRLSGKLIKMTADSVVLDVRRTETTVPCEEIDYMRFFDEVSRTQNARDYMDDRRFEEAARELSNMREKWSEIRPIAALDGLYLLATAKAELALSGVEGHSLTDAVNLVRDYREKGKEHYNFYPSGLLFARLAKAANRLDLAKEELEALTGTNDARVLLDANLDQGFLLLQEKDYVGARSAFSRAEAVDASDPESLRKKTVARIYLSVASAGEGQGSSAVSDINNLIKTQSPDDYYVNAYAYNALGKVHMMQNQLKEAEVAYLHTDLLFAANADAHAEALYNLVQIWNQLGKSDRVTEGREKLINRYGGSFWTSRLNSQ